MNVENFSFDLKNQEIIALQDSKEYIGRKDEINILPRLIKKYLKNNQFEAHLQTYILQKFYQTKLL